ncbi:MAG: Vitamin B12 transporter BtuB [Steroidobacteraceae bacterium]|nr:Vitamin B12 transporter BtuB [Steroidobacteraceae bacterium]
MIHERKNDSRKLTFFVSIALALLGAGPVGAQAQSPAVIIDIPAMPMASALTELAHETGINVLFSPDSVRGLQSTPVSARLTPADAARRLIAGTQLVVLQDSAGALIVRKPAVEGFPGDEAHAASDAADQAGAIPVVPAAAPPVNADSQAGGQPPVDRQPAASAAKAASAGAVTGLEEVIVTAQKREENLQDTPISIAVLGAGALLNRGITSLTDLVSGAVPSLHIVPFTGRSSAVTIGMRGIVPIDATQISRDPAVGIYVDGVYLGRVQGLGTELLDIERLEVLRGPQGTLFGRNAVGGAVNMITKKPTGALGLDLAAGVSNYDGRTVKGHVNLPEFAGISLKIDGVWNERNGWVDNPLAGQSDWFDIDRHGVRVAALWEPADNFSAQYSFDKSRDASTSGYTQVPELLPGAPPLAPIFSLEPERVSRGRAGVPLEPSVGDVQGHDLHITWDLLEGLSLRSISAYREMSQSQFDNAAGSFLGFRPNGFFGRYSLADVRQHQFSEELQLVGSSERLNYVLGAFYFDEDAADNAYAPVTARFNATGTAYTVLPAPLGGPFPDRASVAHAKSRALFGQATWTPPVLGDRLHLTGGLRWTHDTKDGRLTALRGAPTPLAFTF